MNWFCTKMVRNKFYLNIQYVQMALIRVLFSSVLYFIGCCSLLNWKLGKKDHLGGVNDSILSFTRGFSSALACVTQQLCFSFLSGPCDSAEKNCRLAQSVHCAHGSVSQQFFYSLWGGLCVFCSLHLCFCCLCLWSFCSLNPQLPLFFLTETCQHFSSHTADWNHPVYSGGQGGFVF